MKFPNFRRITSSTNYIAELDGLRFLAIMPVVFGHIQTHLMREIEAGEQLSFDYASFLRHFMTFGVPLFYSISGFILSLPFAKAAIENKQPIPLGKFYKRRLTRLEPPYILSLIFFLLVHVMVFGVPFGEALPHFAASFFYLHNVIYGEWSTINPVAWTLEIEFQFYLMAPFIATAIFSLASKLRVALLVGLMLFFVYVESMLSGTLETVNLNRTILTKAQYFLAGFLMCHFFLTAPTAFNHKGRLWDIVGITGILLSGLEFFVVWPKYIEFTIFLIGVVCMFLGCFKGTWLNRFFRWAPISIIGGMCYSIYLLHYPMIHAFTKFFGVVDFAPGHIWVTTTIYAIIYTPIIILVSGIFYLLIERPCMDPKWPGKLMSLFRKKPSEDKA